MLAEKDFVEMAGVFLRESVEVVDQGGQLGAFVGALLHALVDADEGRVEVHEGWVFGEVLHGFVGVGS